jgi:hypothetical protein
MKAKDLAALAALGVAGYAAYDKFGKKGEEPKLRGKLGASGSAVDDSAGEYRSDMLGQGRSANEGDAGESEARMSKRSRQENDVPDRIMGRDAAGSRFTDRAAVDDDYVMPRTAPSADASAAFKKVKAAGANAKTASSGSLSSTGGPSRYNRAADSNDASTSFRNQEEAMAAYVPRRTAAAAAGPTFSSSEEGMANYVPRRTPGAADGVGSTFSSSAEGMENYVPRRVAPAATSSSTEEGMQNYVPRRYNPAADSNTASSTAAGMANYVPRRTATASSTAAGMAAYVPRNAAAVEQARIDALRSSGGRRAKGGVVKMAKGGLASSKMSKPSGASRGDGIAQRGRTRGTLR